MKLKYLKEDLRFIKALWSPFKPFGLKFYFGKVRIGTPYFYPRRIVKFTEQDAIEKAKEMMAKHPNVAPKHKTFEEWVEHYRGFNKAVPRKIGFDFVRLGWKTKWDEDDYRFEWAPLLSFVFFGLQIAVSVRAPHQDYYWEAWLYYEYSTDHRLPKWIRVRQCREKFPMRYTIYHKSKETWETEREETVDYYELILRNKYLKV